MKHLYFITGFITLLCVSPLQAQCPMPSAVSDVTLNCSSGTANRTGVAFNPNQNLYYSVNAGSSSYPIETFSVTGGNSLGSTTQNADYRGFWWNGQTNSIEGNTFNSGGIYRHDLASGTFYAAGTVSLMSSGTMPTTQSMGYADVPNNIVLYYNAGTLYKYVKSTGILITSFAITGLPVASSNLNNYAVAYTGVPGGEALVYDYVNKRVYFINYNTGAYLTMCQLPNSAPAASSFQFGFANQRVFLYNSSSSQWFGYRVLSNSAVAPVASPSVICTGGSVVLSNTASSSYTWTNGPANSSMTVTPSVTTSYSIVGTNTAGCTASAVITVTVNGSVPSLTITPSATAACLGQTVSLNATGALSYTWNNGVTNGSVFSPTTSNNYIVQGQNACGTTSATISIPVAPLPVQIVAGSTVVCAGLPAQLTASAVATTYTWLPSNANSSIVSVAPQSATSYTLIASNGQCMGSAVISLAVNPSPTLSIAATQTNICAGESSTLTVSGASTYTWQQGGNGTSIVVTPTTSTLFSVNGTNSFGCTTGASIPVVTKVLPLVNVSASQTLICSGQSATLNATGNSSSYSWSSGGTAAAEVVTPLTNQGYTVIGTAANGCTASAMTAIALFSPTVSITGNTMVCLGKSTVLTASGADNYDWIGFGPFQAITVSPSVQTTYTLSITSVSDNVTCSNEFYVPVTVNANPSVSVAVTNTVMCTKEVFTFTATGASNYLWSNSSTLQTTTFSTATVGNYTISVKGTDVNGCQGNKTLNIRVNACTGFTENGMDELNVYPNPTKGLLNFKADKPMELQLIDATGKRLAYLYLSEANQYTIQLDGLSSGVYFIVSPQLTLSKKIIVLD